MTAIRRLALCLDGTWNNRDDSTNVLHHFGLATENRTTRSAPTRSHKSSFISRASGQAPDKITGGGFGFGLETNVRGVQLAGPELRGRQSAQACRRDLIFGFSRGAFTARSLVGFISTCGLLRRGAPLTVNQLWQNYCLLGRQHDHTGPLTASSVNRPEFRRLPDLVGSMVDPRRNPDSEAHQSGAGSACQ